MIGFLSRVPADLLHDLSTNELKKEIDKLVCQDLRSLPPRSKVFAAIAKLQKFDLLPEVVDSDGLDKLIGEGYTEIQRGMAATKGVPTAIYADELLRGPMYPGTLVAIGNGMYFACPSKQLKHPIQGFRRYSEVALRYTKGDTGYGMIVRGAVNPNARIIDKDEFKENIFFEFRSRAKHAGIADLGSLAAALGFEALYCDGLYDDIPERVCVVLNRSMLTMQESSLKIQHSLSS